MPEAEGLRGYAVHCPYPGTDEHPADVTAVVTAWFDDGAQPDPGAWFADASITAYSVAERVCIDYERDWPDGTPSPGPRRISFVQRGGNVSRDEMGRHWRRDPLPARRVHHPALWRYVQNVVVEPLTAGAPEVDGIAELHFRTLDDLRDRFYDSDEGKRVIGTDVEQFLDRTKGWRMIVEETWLRS